MVPCKSYNLYSLHVTVFLSAYTWSDTESALRSQDEGEGIPLSVTHQQQHHAEDRPQAELSMCNVKLAITLIPRLNEGHNKPGNKVVHFLKFSFSGWCQSHSQFVSDCIMFYKIRANFILLLSYQCLMLYLYIIVCKNNVAMQNSHMYLLYVQFVCAKFDDHLFVVQNRMYM